MNIDDSHSKFKNSEVTTIQTKDTVPKKARTTVYMTEEEESLLNELFIKRLRDRKKTDKSALFCEGIKLLYDKEIALSISIKD